jgi:hypothetical protein
VCYSTVLVCYSAVLVCYSTGWTCYSAVLVCYSAVPPPLPERESLRHNGCRALAFG